MAGRKSQKNADRKAPVAQSKRADVVFPVGRITRYLKEGRYSE